MPKTNASISLDSEVLDRIDAYAKQFGENRSQTIEMLATKALDELAAGNENYEFFRMAARATQLRSILGGKDVLSDKLGGVVEVTLRVSRDDWAAFQQGFKS